MIHPARPSDYRDHRSLALSGLNLWENHGWMIWDRIGGEELLLWLSPYRLVGRQVTVVLNDRKIIDKQTIEGLTAIASDPDEGKPGPFILQGDHGPVEFSNIVVTPLTR